MNHSALSREHATALLQRLAEDDGFRSRFELKPAKALAELGVPLETIVDLAPACLQPPTLASKEELARAAQEMNDAVVEAAMSMRVPHVQLRSGS
ncbi:MAG: NHLP-related RiPP peptide [Dokdonella sp.]